MDNSREAQFNVEDLFFSTTDKRGIILSFNSVFSRIAEYESEDLVNKPHSIIRHEDMPRSVFKLLWDSISNNEPLVAYVKNKTKSGKYYWVIACAMPTTDGYLSIRLKPTSKLLPIVENLYKVANEYETIHGMDKTIQMMVDELKKLGFHSYKEFMLHALTTEMEARDEKLKILLSIVTSDAGAKKQAFKTAGSNRNLSLSEQIFYHNKSVIENFQKFDGQAAQILKSSKEVSILTTNMSISSDKMGALGAALSVVALKFQETSEDFKKTIYKFQDEFLLLKNVITDTSLKLCLCRFQMEMIHFFKVEDEGFFEKEDFENNINLLMNLTRDNIAQARKDNAEFYIRITNIKKSLNELISQLTGMEVIRISGRIEVSKIQLQEEAFLNHLNFMEKISASFSESLKSLDNACLAILANTSEVRSKIQNINI